VETRDRTRCHRWIFLQSSLSVRSNQQSSLRPSVPPFASSLSLFYHAKHKATNIKRELIIASFSSSDLRLVAFCCCIMQRLLILCCIMDCTNCGGFVYNVVVVVVVSSFLRPANLPQMRTNDSSRALPDGVIKRTRHSLTFPVFSPDLLSSS
jgi:hypothetical protein